MTPTHCTQCQSANIYQDRELWICAECFHEWMPDTSAATTTHPNNLRPSPSTSNADDAGDNPNADTTIRDANGNILANGDSVIVIKDLKIKGSSSTVKSGTKVKNIRLADMGDGHNIACKIDGIGSINLKSEFVRKA